MTIYDCCPCRVGSCKCALRNARSMSDYNAAVRVSRRTNGKYVEADVQAELHREAVLHATVPPYA